MRTLSRRGSDHVTGGSRNNSVRPAGGAKDTIDCGPGQDFALVDTRDK